MADVPKLSTRPIWEAIVIGLVALCAAVSASQVASSERLAQEQLSGIGRGLELLGFEREISVAGNRFVVAVLMQMYEGGHRLQVDSARGGFLTQLVETHNDLDEFQPSDGWRQTHREMAQAVEGAIEGFEVQRSPSEWISWVDEFLTAVRRVVPADASGDWSALLEAVTWVQDVPLVGRQHLERVMAVEWRSTGRLPRDRALLDRYQTALAALRYVRESRGPEIEGYSPFESLILRHPGPSLDPETVAMIGAVAVDPAVGAIEGDSRFLLGLDSEPVFPSVQGAHAFVRESMGRLASDVEEVRAHALTRLDETASEAQRREGLARAGGVLGVLLALMFATRVVLRRRRVDQQLRQALECDILTGTANRYALFANVVPRLNDPGCMPAAMIQVDLDHFKSINDNYGHYAGDMAIVAFADALMRTVRSTTDLVARVGGDEFLIVQYRVPDPMGSANAFIERLRQRLVEPVEVGDGQRVSLVFSAGVAVAYEPTPIEDLMMESDLALIEAKERGRAGSNVFRRSLGRQIVHDLSDALARSEIGCEFQPQVDLHTGDLVGCEALVRWRRDDGLYVSALDIVEAIERLGASRRWLRLLMRDVEEAWTTVGDRLNGRIWVNLMGADLREEDTEALIEVLSRGTTPIDRLGVEITEPVIYEDLEPTIERLVRLREAGLAVALDNVGDPRVPLIHAAQLPLDVIKVERTLVAGIQENAGYRAIIESLVGLAGRLGLELIAEGVETEADADALRALGVSRAQGFLYAPALPVADLARFASDQLDEDSRRGTLRSVG